MVKQSRRIPLNLLKTGRAFFWHDHGPYVKAAEDSSGIICVKADQQRPRRMYIGRNALVNPASTRRRVTY